METPNKTTSSSLSRPIIIIDGLNIFLRSYMVNETMNANGELYGGTVGFLKSIKFFLRTFSPKKIIVVWEQGGGCPKRKHIYPEYKANRVKQKDFEGMYSDRDQLMSDVKTKTKQLQCLTDALGTLPIHQVYLQDTEADDVIAYLVKHKFGKYSTEKDTTKIVVSSDKDFYQLLEDPTVKVYSPGTKLTINREDIIKTYNIAPVNFCLARSLCGDVSDNIPGIEGIGLKTVAKRFDLAVSDKEYSIELLLKEAKEKIEQAGKKKLPVCYHNILESEEIIKRNWKLMYLDSVSLAPNQVNKINHRIDNMFEPIINKLQFIKTFSEHDLPVTDDMIYMLNDIKILTVN